MILKRLRIFFENLTNFFANVEKSASMTEFVFKIFLKDTFGNSINVTFILQQLLTLTALSALYSF